MGDNTNKDEIEIEGDAVRIIHREAKTDTTLAVIDIEDLMVLGDAFKRIHYKSVERILWVGDGLVIFEVKNDDETQIRAITEEGSGELLLHLNGGEPYLGTEVWVFTLYGEEMYIITANKDEVRIYKVDDWEFILSSLEGHNGYEPMEVIKR